MAPDGSKARLDATVLVDEGSKRNIMQSQWQGGEWVSGYPIEDVTQAPNTNDDGGDGNKPPRAPGRPTVKVLKKSIKGTWKRVSGATGYKVRIVKTKRHDRKKRTSATTTVKPKIRVKVKVARLKKIRMCVSSYNTYGSSKASCRTKKLSMRRQP